MGQIATGVAVTPPGVTKAAIDTAGDLGKVAATPVTAAYKGTKNAIAGATARNVDELKEVSPAIKAVSNAAYKEMRDIGADIQPNAVEAIIKNIETKVAESGKVNDVNHAPYLNLLNQLKKEATQAGRPIKDVPGGVLPAIPSSTKSLGLEDFDKYRRELSDLKGKPEVRRLAQKAIEAMDESINGLTANDLTAGGEQAIAALNKARESWSTARKFDTITDIVRDSGNNPNNLKRMLTKFVNDPNKTRGFSAEEIKALKYAADTTGGEKLLNILGKFGIDPGSSINQGRSVLSLLTGGGIGASIGGAPGAVIGTGLVVVGTGARGLQKLIAKGKVEKALQTIEKPNIKTIIKGKK